MRASELFNAQRTLASCRQGRGNCIGVLLTALVFKFERAPTQAWGCAGAACRPCNLPPFFSSCSDIEQQSHRSLAFASRSLPWFDGVPLAAAATARGTQPGRCGGAPEQDLEARVIGKDQSPRGHCAHGAAWSLQNRSMRMQPMALKKQTSCGGRRRAWRRAWPATSAAACWWSR